MCQLKCGKVGFLIDHEFYFIFVYDYSVFFLFVKKAIQFYDVQLRLISM
jgi:hypothetical protein